MFKFCNLNIKNNCFIFLSRIRSGAKIAKKDNYYRLFFNLFVCVQYLFLIL